MNYQLLDAGHSKKLEKFGAYTLIRPEVNAFFKSQSTTKIWMDQADYEFEEKPGQKGFWKIINNEIQQPWIFDSGLGFIMQLELSQFKHIGVFPEQFHHWKTIQKRIKKDQKFLNLFAYTGAASLAAKVKGADVTHVDSVKRVITTARKNMELSNLQDIRWIADDAFTFIKREAKRNKKYHGMIIDPPAYGIGKNKKRWKIDELLESLCEHAYQCLHKTGFMIINIYASSIKTEELKALARKIFVKHHCEVYPLFQKLEKNQKLLHNRVIQVMPKT